jgi:hypothetical protein
LSACWIEFLHHSPDSFTALAFQGFETANVGFVSFETGIIRDGIVSGNCSSSDLWSWDFDWIIQHCDNSIYFVN